MRRVDLAGKTFGKLRVLKLCEYDSKLHGCVWECFCEACGRVVRKLAGNLTHGRTKSCGCYKGRFITERKTQHGHTLQGRRTVEYTLWIHARERAKKYGLEFDIELQDVVIPRTCPLLGIPLKPSKGKVSPNSPSLDRIDPMRGYIKDNVWVISFRANSIKNDATLTELTAVAGAVERKLQCQVQHH